MILPLGRLPLKICFGTVGTKALYVKCTPDFGITRIGSPVTWYTRDDGGHYDEDRLDERGGCQP